MKSFDPKHAIHRSPLKLLFIRQQPSTEYQTEAQFRHIFIRSSGLELDEGNGTDNLFRVSAALGTRWIIAGDRKSGDKNLEVKAYIEGIMVAEYLMLDDPGPGTLNQFAMNNARFHSRPYWRKYLTGQCPRMNLPKRVIPAAQFASSHDSNRGKPTP